MLRIIACVIGILACPITLAQSVVSFPISSLEIDSGEKRHRFTIELAVTPEQKMRGLMFRKHLDPDKGMLFDYGSPQEISMWMKNTYISLDMIFIRADGRILRIAENTEPMSTKIISSRGLARGVLEVIAGTAQKYGIQPGDRVGQVELAVAADADAEGAPVALPVLRSRVLRPLDAVVVGRRARARLLLAARAALEAAEQPAGLGEGAPQLREHLQSYNLQFTIYKLQVTSYKLQVTRAPQLREHR